MAVVITKLLEEDDVEASAIQLFFWGQCCKICPFSLHWKHFPSLIHLIFSSSVIVTLAQVRPISIVLGSQ